jgi:glycosyltransferase involved in cell wall biosynthesis
VASKLSYLTGERAGTGKGLFTEQDLSGVRVLRAYTYPALHRSFLWRIVSFISFMLTSVCAALKAGPVDIVMGTSPQIFQAVSAWLVASLRRRPFLLEIRDLWPEFAIDMGVLKNPVLIAISRGVEKFLYARATHILVNSPAYRDYLINKGIKEAKISLIPNGVDPNMFKPDSTGNRIRREFGLNGQFVVTYAGALGLANDIPTILQAAHYLRAQSKIQFLLVGDGKERHRLKEHAQKLSLSNVTFTGSRPKTDMTDILAASDACIATLKDISMFRMTYPNKVFDYMAAGRPILLAIDGVIREVVEAAQAGIYIQPGDPKSLAEAVRYLVDHREEAEAMSRRGRLYVEKYFNRADQSRQFILLLEKVATHG